MWSHITTMFPADSSQVICPLRNRYFATELAAQSNTVKSDTNFAAFIPYALLIIVQLLDLKFTLTGISWFGTDIEANPIIHLFFPFLGITGSLIFVKSFAVASIVLLASLSNKISWISNAIWGINCFYLIAAIIPWTIILTSSL
jgi:hypothetical protein